MRSARAARRASTIGLISRFLQSTTVQVRLGQQEAAQTGRTWSRKGERGIEHRVAAGKEIVETDRHRDVGSDGVT